MPWNQAWKKPKPITNEANTQTHYCRICEQEFTTIGKDSAHHLALCHYIRDHDQARRYRRCSSFCELRAQPEELEAGHRMYGPGAPKGIPTKTYDELFPLEED